MNLNLFIDIEVLPSAMRADQKLELTCNFLLPCWYEGLRWNKIILQKWKFCFVTMEINWSFGLETFGYNS